MGLPIILGATHLCSGIFQGEDMLDCITKDQLCWTRWEKDWEQTHEFQKRTRRELKNLSRVAISEEVFSRGRPVMPSLF